MKDEDIRAKRKELEATAEHLKIELNALEYKTESISERRILILNRLMRVEQKIFELNKKTTKDKIETGKDESVILKIKQPNTEQLSYLFCDRIEYQENHLMAYLEDKLIFKVWLNKKFKDTKAALKSAGIEV